MHKIEDQSGVGGFTESLLAIMVVTAAVVLFTITISLDLSNWDDRERAQGMEDCCDAITASMMDNCTGADGKALSASSLESFLFVAPSVPGSAMGYSITVKDMRSGETMASAGNGTDPLPGSPIATTTWPVAIELVDGSLVPGLLEVSCW